MSAANSNNPAEPPLRRVATRLCADVFPEAAGLCLVATLLAGLFAVGGVTYRALSHDADAAFGEHGRTLAGLIAAELAGPAASEDESARVTFERLVNRSGIVAARWRDAEGLVRMQWPSDGGPGRSGAAAIALASGRNFATPIPGPNGRPAGTLELTLAWSFSPSHGRVFLSWGLFAAASLLVFLLIYYRLLRHVRPIQAVQRSLLDYAAGIEHELRALALSDSLGEVARGWNRLIQQLVELRRAADESRSGDSAGGALQRFESRTLRRTLDRLQLGVLRFGLDQRISYANAAVARLLSRTEDSIVGRLVSDVLEAESAARLLGAHARATASLSFDRMHGPDEHAATLRFTLLPAKADPSDGESIVTIEDVSHVKEVERARDNFLYHVTHELRTPLTNIQAYAETLTKPSFDDEQTRRECYNVIISETRRLSRLVEDILNVSQLEVGTARVELDDVDLVRLLRQMVQDNLGAADEKRIDLTLKLPPKVPKLRGDKQRLSVMINNLIGNAVKYTPEGGEVSVTLELRERHVRILVKDTGIGIDPTDQPRVFEKFYRADSEQVRAVPGTGLGLAIAREVARVHGGDIYLQSQPGKGSTFTVELPVAEEVGGASPSPAPAAVRPRTESSQGEAQP